MLGPLAAERLQPYLQVTVPASTISHRGSRRNCSEHVGDVAELENVWLPADSPRMKVRPSKPIGNSMPSSATMRDAGGSGFPAASTIRTKTLCAFGATKSTETGVDGNGTILSGSRTTTLRGIVVRSARMTFSCSDASRRMMRLPLLSV